MKQLNSRGNPLSIRLILNTAAEH